MGSKRGIVGGIVGGVVIGLIVLSYVGEEALVFCSTTSVIIGLAFVKQTDWREGGLWGFIIAFVIGFVASVDAGSPAATWQPTILTGLTGAAAGVLTGAIFFLCRQQVVSMAEMKELKTALHELINKQDAAA